MVRAQIVSLISTGLYAVKYVDYGRVVATKLSQLYPIPEHLLKLPPMAVECRLRSLSYDEHITLSQEESLWLSTIEADFQLLDYAYDEINAVCSADLRPTHMKRTIVEEILARRPQQDRVRNPWLASFKLTNHKSTLLTA